MGILGSKTKNLQKLQKAGFDVPPFYALSAEDLIQKSSKNLAEVAHRALGASSYAVRSSALSEDTRASAHAGEFKTVLNVLPVALGKAIEAVAKDAQKKLGTLKNFSILIQEFIEPDYAGVFFTQNPSSDRGWLMEYHAGRGEELVSGSITPVRKRGYWDAYTPPFEWKSSQAMLETFRAIEGIFKFPQDIEWCLQGERLYVLQSRPITTLQPAMLHLMQDVEKDLPTGDFLFEKTEISEIAPRPDDETWALLQRIYKKGGPVQKAYAHYGLSYTPCPFLKRLGGELYVDREAELHSLFPAMSFFKRARILEKPRFAQMKGLRQTLRNAMRLRSLPHEDYASYAEALRRALYAKSLGDFYADYELIFKINLISASALARLKTYLRHSQKQPSLSALLQGGTALFPGLLERWEAPKHCVGNSLDLQDTSPFKAHLNEKAVSSLLPWWNSLRTWERKALEEPLKAALAFLRLREYARWLLVRHTNQLRPKARRKAASSREVLLPKRLASRPLESPSALLGVSSGKVRARLITLEEAKAGRKGILMTRLLYPDLLSYFPHLQGIVSEEGGLLSHLAIMAREKGLPVLVGVDLSALKAGDFMSLDAENGCYEIEKSA